MSEVAICSNALSYLGEQPITSLTDDLSERAKLCNRIYATTRDSLLQEHEWNFAVAYSALGLTTETHSVYAYVFQLPVDLLQPLDVGNTCIDYRIEKDKLLTTESSITLRYIKRVTDPTLFSAKFTRALEYQLALLMAIPLTGDLKKAQLMGQFYADAVGRGKNLDTKAEPTREYQSDNLLEARW